MAVYLFLFLRTYLSLFNVMGCLFHSSIHIHTLHLAVCALCSGALDCHIRRYLSHTPAAILRAQLLANQEGANTERYIFGGLFLNNIHIHSSLHLAVSLLSALELWTTAIYDGV